MTCLIMTLEEMLKLALGTATPDHVNIAILHSFLHIVLKKLEMQDNFVEISGPEVSDLRDMLCQAKNPIIQFKSCGSYEDEKVFCSAKMTTMEDEINLLSKKVAKMETHLKEHLAAAEKCKKTPADGCLSFKKTKDKCPDEESFSSDCEDLCTPCDEQNLIACDLLQNRAFLKKLMRRTTAPIIDRVFEFETLIEVLNEKFQNFLNIAEDEHRKTPLIEDCLRELDLVKETLRKQQAEFLATMEEIQDMMDTKLDKVHIPSLKKYLTGRMADIERQLEALINREQCPKAAGVIMSNAQCLCCTTRVCQNNRIFPVPLMANVATVDTSKAMPGRQPRLCIPRDRDRACGGDHTIIRPCEKSLQKSNLIEAFGDKMKLRVGTDNVEYFKGLDGGMYRLAPQVELPCKGQL